MELKLGKQMYEQSGDGSFNRTFMELKLDTIITVIGAISFNRTFMELKYLSKLDSFKSYISFNRTFMELK